MSRLKAWTSTAALAALLVASPAAAQEPRPAAAPAGAEADREAAGQLADSGVDLYGRGQYKEAAELLALADARAHSPAILVFRGKALDKLGKLLEAKRQLEAIVQEELAADASPAFRAAQLEASQLLEALKPRIPTLELDAEGFVSVTLDGAALDVGALEAPLPIDPGAHELVATPSAAAGASAGAAEKKSFNAAEGEQVRVTLGAANTGASGGGTSKWLAPGLAFGIGGAGLVAAAVTGGLFVGKATDLKDQCGSDNVCDPSLAGEVDSAMTLGDVSTTLFVVGGVGCGVGVTLALLANSGDSGSDTGDAPGDAPASALSTTRLHFAPNGITLSGTF